MSNRVWPPLACGCGALALAGCGLQTPDLQSPLQPLDTQALVTGVYYHVKTEIGCAVVALRDSDVAWAKLNGGKRSLGWLDGGVAKLTLKLIVDEKTALTPSVADAEVRPNAVSAFKNGNVVTGQSFSLGLGANLSAEATRTLSRDYTFSLPEDFLKQSERYAKGSQACQPYDGALIGGNLKIADSFFALATPEQLGQSADAPETMQTEITFVVAGSANVTPAWKLVPVSVNSSSTPFFASSRASTDDVIITLGPKTPATQSAHDIIKTGSAVRAGGANGS